MERPCRYIGWPRIEWNDKPAGRKVRGRPKTLRKEDFEAGTSQHDMWRKRERMISRGGYQFVKIAVMWLVYSDLLGEDLEKSSCFLTAKVT
jgi:hypothetical protein